MEIIKIPVLESAEKELAGNGTLSVSTRRRLWEAMGPLEPREQDLAVLRALDAQSGGVECRILPDPIWNEEEQDGASDD